MPTDRGHQLLAFFPRKIGTGANRYRDDSAVTITTTDAGSCASIFFSVTREEDGIS